MNFFKLSSLCFATAVLLLGAFSFANGSDHEENLLDPSLDQPLPQYKSTSVPGFSEAPITKARVPTSKPIAPKSQAVPPPRANIPASDRGTELAPNPLQGLLSGQALDEQTSPSDIQLSQPEPKATTSAPKSVLQPPAIEKKPARTEPREPKKLAVPPSYNSPFDPKPLTPPTPNGSLKTNSPSYAPAITKSATPKKTTTEKKETTKKKVASTTLPELNYAIYRDQSVYPLDPRKPNNPCTKGCGGGACGCGSCLAEKTGFQGRPHQPREPGGYTCGKKCPNKRPQFSVYWPRPLSAKFDERNPERAAARYSGCPQKKLTDCFDKLANFRLIDYQRTDNGYCGPGSDPYGCLGESKVAILGNYIQVMPVQAQPDVSYPLH